ncbi:EH signature domain-containing protein [Cereibacter sp. SYSU M97828]|nr:EH signature domain-containing protein [Cereibacter flavus]
MEKLRRSAQRVMDRFDMPTKAETDPIRLLAEMRRKIERWDWKDTPLSFAVRAARAAFGDRLRDTDDAHIVRTFVLAEIRASTKQGVLGAMVRIYVETFVQGAAHTEALAEALRSVRDRIGGRWQTLLTEVPDLFQPAHVATALGRRMAQMEDPWQGLRAIGIARPHDPGLMDSVHLAFVSSIASKLDDQTMIELLLNWMRPAGQQARVVGASAAIDALLRPWSRHDPGATIKTLLIDRLTELYGHPRVNRSSVWGNVDPQLEAMLLRWISGADIRFLFRVLTEAERGHMWEEREQFWWTLFQQGRIDAVWVAFNNDGHRLAMRKLSAQNQNEGARFGRQMGETDKSLLIMQMGKQIVVEGTYSFKVHGFDASDPRAPRLYQGKYDVAAIRAKSARWKESHNPPGRWQPKVLRHL